MLLNPGHKPACGALKKGPRWCHLQVGEEHGTGGPASPSVPWGTSPTPVPAGGWGRVRRSSLLREGEMQNDLRHFQSLAPGCRKKADLNRKPMLPTCQLNSGLSDWDRSYCCGLSSLTPSEMFWLILTVVRSSEWFVRVRLRWYNLGVVMQDTVTMSSLLWV